MIRLFVALIIGLCVQTAVLAQPQRGFPERPLYPNLHRGLVHAWLPVLGATGGILRNYAGGGGIGTATGVVSPGAKWNAAQTTMIQGWAYDYEVDDTEYHTVPAAPHLRVFPPMTIVHVYNVESFSTRRGFFAKWRQDSGNWTSIKTRINTSGATAFTVQNPSVSQYPSWVSSVNAGAGVWNCSTVVYHRITGNASDVDIWVNGARDGSVSFSANGYNSSFSVSYSSSFPWYIGTEATAGPNPQDYFDGQIAMLLMWERALTPPELTLLGKHPMALLESQQPVVALAPAAPPADRRLFIIQGLLPSMPWLTWPRAVHSGHVSDATARVIPILIEAE